MRFSFLLYVWEKSAGQIVWMCAGCGKPFVWNSCGCQRRQIRVHHVRFSAKECSLRKSICSKTRGTYRTLGRFIFTIVFPCVRIVWDSQWRARKTENIKANKWCVRWIGLLYPVETPDMKTYFSLSMRSISYYTNRIFYVLHDRHGTILCCAWSLNDEKTKITISHASCAINRSSTCGLFLGYFCDMRSRK